MPKSAHDSKNGVQDMDHTTEQAAVKPGSSSTSTGGLQLIDAIVAAHNQQLQEQQLHDAAPERQQHQQHQQPIQPAAQTERSTGEQQQHQHQQHLQQQQQHPQQQQRSVEQLAEQVAQLQQEAQHHQVHLQQQATLQQQVQQQQAVQQDEPLRDVYSFPLSGLTQQQLAACAACAAYEARRSSKWQEAADSGQLPQGATLKRYCRKGVPHELRSWVWWETSGAAKAAAAAPPGHYAACLVAGQDRQAVKQIELDLPRTFPGHPWLAQPEGQAALRNVLTAYAGHNAEVGYCQGMNFLAGLLLLAVEHDCHKAFWLLLVLLEQVLYPGTYAKNLDGCHVEMGCLGQLLQQKQPKLAAHLQSIGCEASLLSTDWYLCLYSTSLPAETAARLWDALFLEGRKVLHRMGLALLTEARNQLMKLDNAGEVLCCMKNFTAGCYDRNELMSRAFKGIGSLPHARITKIQQAEAAKVSAMLAARAAKHNNNQGQQ